MKIAAFALAFVAALAYLMPDEVDEAELYCEMRAIHAATNGEFGWPRHNEAAEQECGRFDF